MIVLYTKLHNMFNQSNHTYPKCGIMQSIFNFLFGTSSSIEDIKAIQNNMEILKSNQDTVSTQIKQTNAERNTNRLLLTSLHMHIILMNSTVHCLSKELKALILDRNFFLILFQFRSQLASLHNGLNSLRINILSIIHQVSVISSQKLTPALLSPHDLTSLLTKLETKLISYPQLALTAWHGENIWCMYKFMKLQSFIISNTLYTVLHTPLVDKSLQFHIFRIHNIPLVHPTLKKSFQYNIQEEYLTIRSDKQYISFPPSADIMACQVSNGQYYHINTLLYTADTYKFCSYALFLQIVRK